VQRVLPNNLPVQPTPFIGRQQELRDLKRLLCDEPASRLLTLLGPGGCGKSRLAIEAGMHLAESNAGQFPDGVWFVPLAALSSADSVILEIAKAINMTFMADDTPRLQQLSGYLAQRRLLLIIDNYEHLLNKRGPTIPVEILGEAEQVTILVTSRIRLNVQAEQLFPVSGLLYPGLGSQAAWSSGDIYSAIILFETSAQRVRKEFSLTESNWPAVVEICKALNGMPLALELAAAWIEALDPEEIAAEITKSIDFLSATWVDIPKRQRSMRAVFNASWELLSQAEKESLKRLSVFRGPFPRAAAAAVTGLDMPVILSLINKSWLARDEQGCFSMHEVLRQFCHQELSKNVDTWREARRRHAAYFAGWLQELGSDLRGAQQRQALSAIEGSFENIRLAWGWLVVEGDLTTLTRQILPAVFQFCTARIRGADIVVMVGAAQGALAEMERSSLEANILRTASLACLYGGYLPRQLDSLLLGIELPDEEVRQLWSAFSALDPLEVDALWPVTIAVIYAWVSRSDEFVKDYLQKLTTVYRQNGQEWATAFALKYLGFLYGSPWLLTPYDNLENLEDESDRSLQLAAKLLTEAAAHFERLGDKLEQADSLRLVGGLIHQSDPVAAYEPLVRARAIFEELGDIETTANLLMTLALRSLWQGDIEGAIGYFRAKHSILKESGNRHRYAMSLDHEAIHAMRFYSINRARRLRKESQEVYHTLKMEIFYAWDVLELGVIEVKAGNLALARDLLGQAETAFEMLDSEYGRMFYDSGMGDFSMAAGDYQTAINYFQASLKQAKSLSHFWLINCILSHLSLAYQAAGDLNSAKRYCREALIQTRDIGYYDLSLIAMLALAGIKAQQDDPESALLLAFFVSNHHLCWLEYKDLARMIIETVTGQLPEGRSAEIQQQALASSKEALLERVLGQEL